MSYFVIVDRQSKLPQIYPNTSELTTASQIQQWITDKMANIPSTQELVESYEPEVRPDVEEKYILINTTQEYFDQAHPIHPELKQFRITHPLIDLPVESKLAAIDDKEMEANETVIPHQQRLKMTILAFDSYLDLVGLTNAAAIDLTSLNVKKKKQLKIFKRAANKIRQNDVERDAKKAALAANPLSNPDLKTNWSLDDFTEEV